MKFGEMGAIAKSAPNPYIYTTYEHTDTYLQEFLFRFNRTHKCSNVYFYHFEGNIMARTCLHMGSLSPKSPCS
jgi:hypothetical protein